MSAFCIIIVESQVQ